MQKITFIINPKAGYREYKYVENQISKYLDTKKFYPNIFYSKSKGDAKKIAQKEIKNGSDIIIAVGGDGTVNEVSSALINSNKKMGVIPIGSGNGLAFSLGISKNIKQAIDKINNTKTKKIDTVAINNFHFINIAGIGFDAFVSQYFSNEKKRGLIKYIYLTLSLLKKYKPKKYLIKVNNKLISIEPFVISICNGPQYGNNFYISPEAKLDDGQINICIVKNFKWYQFITLLCKFCFNKINTSHLYKSYVSNQVIIESETANIIHLDGESKVLEKNIHVNVIPKSINFII